MVDWGKAVVVSAIGVTNVFVVLAILWISIYAVGLVIQKAQRNR